MFVVLHMNIAFFLLWHVNNTNKYNTLWVVLSLIKPLTPTGQKRWTITVPEGSRHSACIKEQKCFFGLYSLYCFCMSVCVSTLSSGWPAGWPVWCCWTASSSWWRGSYQHWRHPVDGKALLIRFTSGEFWCYNPEELKQELTSVLRFPLLSPATDTDREKYFPGDALLGLLDMGSWEPDRLRSRASSGVPVEMDVGLRVVCILLKPAKQTKCFQSEEPWQENKLSKKKIKFNEKCVQAIS